MTGIIAGLLKLIVVLIIFIGIPAIPGVLLYWFLQPVMFWEKFAWILLSGILFVIIDAFLVRSVMDLVNSEDTNSDDDDNRDVS